MSVKKKKRASPKPVPTIPVVGLEAAKKAVRAKEQTARKHETKTQIEDHSMTNKANFEKFTTDTTALNKEQLDAFMKSSNLLLKGTEDIMKTYMAMAQDSMQKSSEAMKTLLGCKTLNELTEAQNKLAQESFDGFMTGATKLSEMSVKVATDSFEPLTKQMSKTIQKATESVAA